MDPARPRTRTGAIGGNQDAIDELEGYLEGIGRLLLGADGGDLRKLAEYVPVTRNMSALLDAARAGGPDVTEDLKFLHGELDGRASRHTFDTPDWSELTAVFRFGRYLDLVEHPEKLIEAVEPSRRLELASLVTRGTARLGPVLAKVNVFAWLNVVGLPNLARELAATGAAASLVLVDPSPAAKRGLTRVLTGHRPPPSPGVHEFAGVVYEALLEEYRGQLARQSARTQPL